MKRVKIYKSNRKARNLGQVTHKVRNLGISTLRDKLVLKVLHLVLSALYDPTFSPTSHGFRPARSPHSAIGNIRQKFKGTV